MSTHRLDVSGARALTATTNDPASTAAQMPAKSGDDVAITLGALSEIRLGVGDGARIQRRRYVTRTQRRVDGAVAKDENGEIIYDEKPYEALVLVLSGSATIFGRTSHLPSENAPDKPSYEGTPHTGVYVKRWGDEPHFLESGELIEELDLAEALAAVEAREEARQASIEASEHE